MKITEEDLKKIIREEIISENISHSFTPEMTEAMDVANRALPILLQKFDIAQNLGIGEQRHIARDIVTLLKRVLIHVNKHK